MGKRSVAVFRFSIGHGDVQCGELCVSIQPPSSYRSERRILPPTWIDHKNSHIVIRSTTRPIGSTHTGELDATVTALGSSALLLDMEVPELTAGGLDDANLVGPRVVPVDEIPSISCS